jgi:hypothetical protein
MMTVSTSDVSNVLLMEWFGRKHVVDGKVGYFTRLYGMGFKEFEKKVKAAGEEKFAEWDDYMEWKACLHQLKDIEQNIAELKSGKFKLA